MPCHTLQEVSGEIACTTLGCLQQVSLSGIVEAAAEQSCGTEMLQASKGGVGNLTRQNSGCILRQPILLVIAVDQRSMEVMLDEPIACM